MTEEGGKSIKVREQEAEITVKDGNKTFKYARDSDGKLRIVEAVGLAKNENEPRLLNRLLNAKPSNCSRCLDAEIKDALTVLYFMEFMEEDDLFCF